MSKRVVWSFAITRAVSFKSRAPYETFQWRAACGIVGQGGMVWLSTFRWMAARRW